MRLEQMRSEEEMLAMLLEFAQKDKRVRVVGMEGSRTNCNVPRDFLQDFDISYLVTDLPSFLKDESWLDQFGERLILQKPEAMALFPAELGNWFSYLIIFSDGNKLDLTLVPLEELEQYLAHDTLLKILLDKDRRLTLPPLPHDTIYHVTLPSARYYDDCQNEFWFTATYVAKGLVRGEFLFAVHHMTHILHTELLRMVEWKVGLQTGFALSVGKNYKYLEQYLSSEEWQALQATFGLGDEQAVWKALAIAFGLMRTSAKEVGRWLGYEYPAYDENVSGYIEALYKTVR